MIVSDGMGVMQISYHDNFNEVQADAALSALFAGATGPFDRLSWFTALVEECGMTPLIAIARKGDAIAALPLARGGAGLGPLANWYAFTVRPLVTPDAALLPTLARDLRRRAGQLTLAPLPNDDGEADSLAKALRAGGWWVVQQPCDTNHHLALQGRSYAQYLETRPGPLRTTLKRKAKKVSITLFDHFDAAAWDHYEAIYAQSWKPEEGSPAFLRRFAREEGAAGRLRMGVAFAADEAIAAQMWTVDHGTAYIHKLAYVESAKPLSPGTSLSAALFERVIDTDGVDFVDFGTGDDPYKRDWMETQRPRYRITAHNPGAPAQWPAMGKAMVKQLVGTLRRD
jgi:CelD/BcsL family acetyltransferase involved in cellulose biosynthesis